MQFHHICGYLKKYRNDDIVQPENLIDGYIFDLSNDSLVKNIYWLPATVICFVFGLSDTNFSCNFCMTGYVLC